MKFVHTADWHLGRALGGVSLLRDQQHALDQLLALLDEERPDFLIVAGDIYDRAIPPVDAIELLDNTLSAIVLERRIPAILISGNHDSAERIGFGTRLLRENGLHLRTRLTDIHEPVTMSGADGDAVDVYTIPYCEPAEARQLLGRDDIPNHDIAMEALIAEITAKEETNPRILVAHAFVEGGSESESERPISVGGSGRVASPRFAPFLYTALGHLHQPQHVDTPTLRYAGSLCRYSFSEEKHRKSFTIVEVNGGAPPIIREIPIQLLRGMRTIEGEFDAILDEARKAPTDDFIRMFLLDKGPVLEPRDRLAPYYPNILEVRRPALERVAEGRLSPGDLQKLSPTELFREFHAYITGRKTDAGEEEVLNEVIADVTREMEEAAR